MDVSRNLHFDFSAVLTEHGLKNECNSYFVYREMRDCGYLHEYELVIINDCV